MRLHGDYIERGWGFCRRGMGGFEEHPRVRSVRGRLLMSFCSNVARPSLGCVLNLDFAYEGGKWGRVFEVETCV